VRTALTRLLVITTTALALTACGGEDTPAADESPSATATTSISAEASPSESAESQAPAPDENVVAITLRGDQVTPNGDRVEVPLGEPVTFEIDADRAGELHVHSTPEQELSFEEGDTRVQVTFDQPGIVEVEDHESGKVVVQLQVS
jgi:hypothetical protein